MDILKTIYTYFFPSIVSVMITLIAQQMIYKNNFCPIIESRLSLSTISLVAYGVVYILWLSRCDYMWLSIIFGFLSLGYIFITWFFCLDRRLTHTKVELDVKEEKAFERMIDEQK
ncbi:MAG: hypothetical protein NC416_12595 [Eubacterium sp.]|nr:hypothetical protein [Eubacterium sp.]